MNRTHATPLHSGQYMGDRGRGCACEYVFMEQQQAPGGGFEPAKQSGRRSRQPSNVNGVSNVDVFASSTGQQARRFYCHRGLTGASPTPMESPPAYQKKTLGSVLRGFAHGVKKAFFSVFRCLIPRVNVGIGINLWRFRA